MNGVSSTFDAAYINIYTHYFTLCIIIIYIYIYVYAHTRSCKQNMQHLDLQSFAQKHAVFKTPGVVTLAVCCTRTWVCARWTVSKRWCAVAMLPRRDTQGLQGLRGLGISWDHMICPGEPWSRLEGLPHLQAQCVGKRDELLQWPSMYNSFIIRYNGTMYII
jgi:hypothetical protein